MASLLLKGIYKVYPSGVTAVTDFNLDIKDKEFIVFVGPSGCGKSTTLRMIAGLEEISKGELYIDGEVHAITAGDWFRISPEGRRAIRAAADSSIRFICIQTKAGSQPYLAAGRSQTGRTLHSHAPCDYKRCCQE